MKKYRKVTLFSILILMVSGIGIFSFLKNPSVEKSIPDSTRQVMQNNLQNQWLLGELCNPPCWAGITPGEATANEAFELLGSLPEIKNIKRYERNLYGEFEWDWKSGHSGGRIFFDVTNQNRIVETILPNMTGYSDSWISFGDVIGIYGEPTHIRVKQYGPIDEQHGYEIPVSYGVEFIWLSQGFSSQSGLGAQDTQLNQNMSLYTLALFTPSLEGYLKYRGNAGKTLQEWRGFDDVLNYLP